MYRAAGRSSGVLRVQHGRFIHRMWLHSAPRFHGLHGCRRAAEDRMLRVVQGLGAQDRASHVYLEIQATDTGLTLACPLGRRSYFPGATSANAQETISGLSEPTRSALWVRCELSDSSQCAAHEAADEQITKHGQRGKRAPCGGGEQQPHRSRTVAKIGVLKGAYNFDCSAASHTPN